MEVANLESEQISGSSSFAEAVTEFVDTGRVFTYKHQSGEIATGTALDIKARCAALGSLSLKELALIAELNDMGQDILNEEAKEEDGLIEEDKEFEKVEPRSEKTARESEQKKHTETKTNKTTDKKEAKREAPAEETRPIINQQKTPVESATSPIAKPKTVEKSFQRPKLASKPASIKKTPTALARPDKARAKSSTPQARSEKVVVTKKAEAKTQKTPTVSKTKTESHHAKPAVTPDVEKLVAKIETPHPKIPKAKAFTEQESTLKLVVERPSQPTTTEISSKPAKPNLQTTPTDTPAPVKAQQANFKNAAVVAEKRSLLTLPAQLQRPEWWQEQKKLNFIREVMGQAPSQKKVPVQEHVSATEIVEPPVVRTQKVGRIALSAILPENYPVVDKAAEGERFDTFTLSDIAEQDPVGTEVIFTIEHDKETELFPVEGALPSGVVSAQELLPENYTGPAALVEPERIAVTEDTLPETVATELSVPVSQIETAIEQLADYVEALEPKETLMVNRLVDQIMQLSVVFENEDINISATQEEVTEELEELFARLFDNVGIEYSPELIQTFVRLTLGHQLEELREPRTEDDGLQDKGTHEFINRLSKGVANINKTVIHAYLIGKSALQLYSLNLASS